jgi:histidyl-tRNA synthetase
LQYADKRGFRVALIAGENEFAAGMVQLKNLQTGEKRDVPTADNGAQLIAALREVLA